jgi:hypothetical protein
VGYARRVDRTAEVGPRIRRPRMRIGALVALAIAAGVVVWLVLRDNGGSNETPNGPVAASLSDLRAAAAAVDHPVYWAGAKAGHTYELTRTADRRVYVRYLGPGVSIGDKRPRFLTVATYPRADGFRDIRTASARKSNVTLHLPNGGLAVYSRERPTNVYFSYPSARYQVEVYSASPQMAVQLVVAGQIVPIRA